MSVSKKLKELAARVPGFIAMMPAAVQPVVKPPAPDASLLAAETEFRAVLTAKQPDNPDQLGLTAPEVQTTRRFAQAHPAEFVDVLRDAKGQPWAEAAAGMAMVVGGDYLPDRAPGRTPVSSIRSTALALVPELTADPHLLGTTALMALTRIEKLSQKLEDSEKLTLLETVVRAGRGDAALVGQACGFALAYGQQKTRPLAMREKLLTLAAREAPPGKDYLRIEAERALRTVASRALRDIAATPGSAPRQN